MKAKRFDGSGFPQDATSGEKIPLGARILKLALDYDALLSHGMDVQQALSEIGNKKDWYDPHVAQALVRASGVEDPYTVLEVRVRDLPDHAVLAEEVRLLDGTILNTKGLEVTPSLRQRLNACADSGGIQEPIKVLVPAE